jgi:peptidoglycan/LPS O-acetylase OafA/YrhL
MGVIVMDHPKVRLAVAITLWVAFVLAAIGFAKGHATGTLWCFAGTLLGSFLAMFVDSKAPSPPRPIINILIVAGVISAPFLAQSVPSGPWEAGAMTTIGSLILVVAIRQHRNVVEAHEARNG